MFKKPGSESGKKGSSHIKLAPPKDSKTPKTSTPNKDETTMQSCSLMSLDIPEVPNTRAARQTPHSMVSTASSVGHRSRRHGLKPKTKEAPLMSELDKAYNNYLIAVAHQHIVKEQMKDSRNQIEAQLGTLSKRLTVDQLMLENTKRKLTDINFRTEMSQALQGRKEAFVDMLGHMEGPTAHNISATSTAMAAESYHLEMKSACSGTAELKKALEESNAILEKLRNSNTTGNLSKVVKAANQIEKITETVQEVDVKLQQVAEKLPTLQSLAIENHVIKTFEANSEQ